MRFEFRFVVALALSAPLVFVACGDDDDPDDGSSDAPLIVGGANFALSSVTRNPDGSRSTFIQTIDSLDEGPFDNSNAVEVQGNAVVLSSPGAFYVGLTEGEPVWIRYEVNSDGQTREDGRLSFLEFGVSGLNFSNVLVDPETAVSVLPSQAIAVVWNPSTMEVIGEVDLPDLEAPPELRNAPGLFIEASTTTAFDGRVYIPGRFTSFPGDGVGLAVDEVVLIILDPFELQVIGTARDDRCASGGRPVFDSAGFAYVIGDGRNNINNLYRELRDEETLDTCLLRIAPGETDFEQSYFHTIPSLTGGLQAITELEAASAGSGLGFAKMFHRDRLPNDVPVDTSYEFWDASVHRLWQIELTDPPRAEPVQGVPFAAVGFVGSAIEGRLYTGESVDGNVTTDVYEIDAEANNANIRFSMDGIFEGLYSLR